MDEAARRMALGQTDADLVRIINTIPFCPGVTGRFDAQRFAQVIRQYGFTEPALPRRAAQAVAPPPDRGQHFGWH